MHTALKFAPAFAGKVVWNVRRDRPELLAECPAGRAGPWQDHHTGNVVLWLQGCEVQVTARTVDAAMLVLARESPVDPLADWLDGLAWDGQERLETWLIEHCGAAGTEATRLISSKFLIGMAARALKPGCQMDNVLALEGAQGIRKSSLARVLGGEYHSEDLPDFHSKDSQVIATTSWVVEIADLGAYRHSELEHAKGFITRTTDTFIQKYEKHKRVVPRWCVFVFTVNPTGAGWLDDVTGNRRVWPITVGEIDIAAVERERDQLLAEAVYCYRRGDPWWIESGDERELLHVEQEARVVEESWTKAIAEWADRQKAPFTTLDVALGPLGLRAGDVDKRVTTRIGIALHKLGFPRRRVTDDAGRRRWEYHPRGEP